MVATAKDKNVTQSGGKGVAFRIFNGNNGKRSLMLFNMLKGTDTSRVSSLSDSNHGSQFKLEDIRHFSSGNIHLDGVIHLGIWVGVTNGTTVVSDKNGNLISRHVDLGDLAEFVRCLLLGNAVKNVTSLGVMKESETITALLQLDDIHESRRVVFVRPDFSVDLDTAFHANLLALFSSKSILEAVTENDAYRKTLSEFVRTRRRAGGKDAHHFAEIPMLGSMEALQMLLGSAWPVIVRKSTGERLARAEQQLIVLTCAHKSGRIGFLYLTAKKK